MNAVYIRLFIRHTDAGVSVIPGVSPLAKKTSVNHIGLGALSTNYLSV